MKNHVVKYSPAQKYLIVEIGKPKEKLEDYLTDDISKAARFGFEPALEQIAEFMRTRELGPLSTKSELFLKKIFLDCTFEEVEDPDTPEFLERLRQYEEASRIGQ